MTDFLSALLMFASCLVTIYFMKKLHESEQRRCEKELEKTREMLNALEKRKKIVSKYDSVDLVADADKLPYRD